jgi:putative RNA 2'-phosphotransferase
VGVSKRLSWLLRHGAREQGLTPDAAGWVPVDAVLAWLRTDRGALERAVEENTKRRLQLDGDRIRCCQGHSMGVGVTLEGLEASWTVFEGQASVWHGTNVGAVDGIGARGVRAQDRTHVHLATALESRVGKRANVAVMLEVSPPALREAGIGIFEAPNGVILARWVPRECIVGLRAMTRAARRDEADLRETLDLD